MNLTQEEIQNMTSKLNVLYRRSPEEYAYLKGWVHCLLYNENGGGDICGIIRENLSDLSDEI